MPGASCHKPDPNGQAKEHCPGAGAAMIERASGGPVRQQAQPADDRIAQLSRTHADETTLIGDRMDTNIWRSFNGLETIWC
jgi:hypothetical protein